MVAKRRLKRGFSCERMRNFAHTIATKDEGRQLDEPEILSKSRAQHTEGENTN